MAFSAVTVAVVAAAVMVEVRASMETVRFNRLTWYRRWKLARVMKKLPPSDVKCEVLGNIGSCWQWRRDVTMIGSWHSLHIILNKAGLRYDPKTEPPTMGALQASEGEHDIGTGEQILSTLVSGMAMGPQGRCEPIPVTGQGVVSRGWWEMAEAGVGSGWLDREGTHAMTEATSAADVTPSTFAGGDWFDPLEEAVRLQVRGFIEELLEEELEAALGRGRYERSSAGKGHRHGRRTRQLVMTFGPLEPSVPRGRLRDATGERELKSASVLLSLLRHG